MPLYVLGFMGMTRRLNTYDNPDWEPYLYVALTGAVFVLIGIMCQLIQVAVSFRDRKINADLTGDPWDGRTMEWNTSSPAPFYNFAHIPHVDDIDTFWDAKEKGIAYKRPAKYEDIHMPTNRAAGVVIGVLLFIFGFAMTWYIWWLAIASLVGSIITFIISSFTKKVDYYVPAAEVERIENERFHKLEQLQKQG